MRERLLITVLVLFAYSCIDAGSTPQTDKEIQLASPGHELTIKTIVNGNRILMANDGEENAAVAEERMASETAATPVKNIFSKITKPFSRAGQSAHSKLTTLRQNRREKFINDMLQTHASHDALLKAKIRISELKRLDPPPSPKRIKKYTTFLQKRIKSIDKLLTSSHNMQWWKVWKITRVWKARRMIKKKSKFKKLFALGVRLNTVYEVRGRDDAYAKGYAKYLEKGKAQAVELLDVPPKEVSNPIGLFKNAQRKTKKSAKVKPVSGIDVTAKSESSKPRVRFSQGTAGNQPTDVQPPKGDEATASTSTSILSKLKPRASAQNPPDNHPQVPPPSP